MARIAILIGNQTFLPDSGLAPLAGPKNDVDALAKVLSDQNRGNFEVATFLDKAHHEITPQLEQALGEARNGDTILIYYAGHGKLDKSGRLCLATADTSKLLYSTSITAAHLGDLVGQSQCECVILILDCCYSGAFGRTLTRGDTESQFASVTQASGLHVFTASTGTQTASELEEDTHGLAMGKFTHAIVEGIRTGIADVNKDQKISLSDLRSFVQDKVVGQTPQYWARAAGGSDPLISLVRAPDAQMARRHERLIRWRDGLRINPRRAAWLGQVCDGEASVELVATVRALLDDLASTPDSIVAALEGIPGFPGGPPVPAAAGADAPQARELPPAATVKGWDERIIDPQWPISELLSRRWLLLLSLLLGALAIGWTVSNYTEGRAMDPKVAAAAAAANQTAEAALAVDSSTASPALNPAQTLAETGAEIEASTKSPAPAVPKQGAGCAVLDEDTDSVNDCIDKCPGSTFGQDIGADGCPMAVSIDLKGVNFDSGKDELRTDAKSTLDEAIRVLNRYEDLKVEIAGHTDSKGSEEFNDFLSQRRAQAVYDYLVSRGISRSRLIGPKGYGERRPLVPNSNPDNSDNPEGRARNNRVEFNVVS